MSEAIEVARDGARPTINSGRSKVPGEKGDARYPAENPVLTIDYKESGKSVTINERMLGKVNMDAIRNGDLAGILKIVLGEDTKSRVFVIPEDVALEMMEMWCNRDEQD